MKIWNVLQFLVPSPLTGLALLAIPVYAWVSINGALVCNSGVCTPYGVGR